MQVQQVFNVVLDLQGKRLGVKANEGGVFCKVENSKLSFETSSFVVDTPVLAYPIKMEEISIGDLIVNNNRVIGFLVAKSENEYSYIKQDGTKVSMMLTPETSELYVKASVTDIKQILTLGTFMNSVPAENVVAYATALKAGLDSELANILLLKDTGINPLLSAGDQNLIKRLNNLNNE